MIHHTLSRLTALGDEQARAELRAYESKQPILERVMGSEMKAFDFPKFKKIGVVREAFTYPVTERIVSLPFMKRRFPVSQFWRWIGAA